MGCLPRDDALFSDGLMNELQQDYMYTFDSDVLRQSGEKTIAVTPTYEGAHDSVQQAGDNLNGLIEKLEAEARTLQSHNM